MTPYIEQILRQAIHKEIILTDLREGFVSSMSGLSGEPGKKPGKGET